MQLAACTVSSEVCVLLGYASALEVDNYFMRYINLLTYLLTETDRQTRSAQQFVRLLRAK